MIRDILHAALPAFLAVTANGADLFEYRQQYEKALEQIVLEQGLGGSDLLRRYAKALNALRERVQTSGDLDKAKAVLGEIRRFESAQAVPAESEGQVPVEVKTLRAAFHEERLSLEKGIAGKTAAVAARYDDALFRLQKELTRTGNRAAATAVQDERKRLKSKDAATAAGRIPAAAVPAPVTSVQPQALAVIGRVKGVETVARLVDGVQAFSNRRYTWVRVPGALPVKRFARVCGGVGDPISAVVREAGMVYIALGVDRAAVQYLSLNGWQATPFSLVYTDRDSTRIGVYRKRVEKGSLVLPRLTWSGPILLMP